MSCELPLMIAAYLWYCRINRSLVGSTGAKLLDVFVLGCLCGKFVWKCVRVLDWNLCVEVCL